MAKDTASSGDDKVEEVEKTDKVEKTEKVKSARRLKNLVPRGMKPKAVAGIGLAVLLGVVLLIGLFGVMIYKYKSDSNIVYAVSKVVPYPIEKVNGSYVSYNEYLFTISYVKHFYQNQSTSTGQAPIDFNSANGKKQLAQIKQLVVNQLQTEAVAKQLINKYHIKVSNSEVNSKAQQIISASGGKAKVVQVLSSTYGWSYNDFLHELRFEIATQKLNTAITADSSINAQAKALADNVLKQIKAGGDFATLAKKYSQDSSASSGGDLGTFGRGQLDKQLEDAAFALQPGQVSDVVKTQYGYSIIEVIDKSNDQVHAAEILIKPIDPTQYVQDQAGKAKVAVFFHA